jgi:hypothetical protein
VLEDAGGPNALSAHQHDLIDRAITASDNAAAAELFAGIERRHGGLAGASDAVASVLREAGDETTQVSTQGRDGFSTYGQTEWSLPLQHRFMAALIGGCLATTASTDFLLNLMRNVTSDRWGLGSVGVPALWKGGWGPGLDGRYLLRQMGAVTVGGKEVVVTIAVRPDNGEFATGQAISSQLAQRVAKQAAQVAQSAPGC